MPVFSFDRRLRIIRTLAPMRGVEDLTSMTMEQWYGEAYDEEARLDGWSIEWERTLALIGRILPGAPAVVADVAGGTGRYATWLAAKGHEVSLLDLIPRHVERARQRAADEGVAVDCVVGDARDLPWPDCHFDVVMVMGALYHLQEAADRTACLLEARRVLKPGGALVTTHINRWAALFDGYRCGFALDPGFRAIIAAGLVTGRHENPDAVPGYFTTAYFHTPEEIREEIASAGFVDVEVLPVEGFVCMTGVPEQMQTAEWLPTVLDDIAATETDPSLLSVSDHLLGLARKPSPGNA